ncbi:CBS domain-containing protein [Nonomuraea indica]|uniref:CBS domain-containing protein n=1 Tax=Nonomuraea indica TaxID=1581193 RepID=A0ABW8AG57_9ACTN|nr:CBS domain-containing protein [Nonomuraea indica]
MSMIIRDVMTTDVAAVKEDDSFRVVTQLLIDKGVSGLPVVDEDGHVKGVVSEVDLLAKEEYRARFRGDEYRQPLRARIRHSLGSEGSGHHKATGETAGQLMTHPAYVTTPDAPVVLAARLMDRHGIKRLPVVDAGGRLVGIVSRRDLLKVFVRADDDIRRELVDSIPITAPWTDPASLDIRVKDGVVTLAGTVTRHSEALSLARVARGVDGVVTVREELTWRHDDVVDIPVWGGA